MNQTIDLRGGHSSGQFSDTEAQQTQDAKRLARKMKQTNRHFLTGTEAGSQSVLADAWRGIDQDFGLKFRKGPSGDVWIVHRLDLFQGKVETEFHKILDGEGGKFADRGFFRVTGECDLVQANLTILAAHWLTDTTDGGRPDGPGNARLAAAATVLGREFGHGHNLCFLGLDANRSEREPGGIVLNAPFVSLAEDTNKIQNTGHGPIDALLRFQGDKRVNGEQWNVLNDKEFPLHSDHWYGEGTWSVGLFR